jgi:hypothetical protein
MKPEVESSILNRWRSVGIVALGMCAALDIAGVVARAVEIAGVVVVGNAVRLPFIALLLVSGVGLRALLRRQWAIASVCLSIAGIFHAVLLIGIVAAVASVRIWATAERVWAKRAASASA